RHEPPGAELLGTHRAARGERGQLLEVDDLVALSVGLAEAALRDAPLERHLPALVARRRVAARAREAPLVAAAGRLARGRPGAASDPLLRPLRARRRAEPAQIDRHYPSTRTRCATAPSIPRTGGQSRRITAAPMRFRPSALSVFRCRGLVPM